MASLKTALARASADQLRQILFAIFEGMNSADRRSLLKHTREITMPRRQRAQMARTSIALALVAAGYSNSAIASVMRLPVRRIREILAGRSS